MRKLFTYDHDDHEDWTYGRQTFRMDDDGDILAGIIRCPIQGQRPVTLDQYLNRHCGSAVPCSAIVPNSYQVMSSPGFIPGNPVKMENVVHAPGPINVLYEPPVLRLIWCKECTREIVKLHMNWEPLVVAVVLVQTSPHKLQYFAVGSAFGDSHLHNSQLRV